MARSLVKHVEGCSAKGQQHWATEKPKLDNVCKLRGACIIDVSTWMSLYY